jgi:hypothetical protein
LPDSKQLVVAFHGTYLFTYWSKTVEILIPRVPEHMYLVEEGDDTMPTPRRFGLLDGGEFPLRGVVGNDVPVVPASNEAVTVHKQRQAYTKENLFCRLFLPNPSRIVSAMVNRPVDESEAIFYGSSAADVETRRFPACMLFVYDQLDSSGLTFGDLPWKPVADQSGVVHLRVYSEDIQCPPNSGPDSVPLVSHMRNAFRRLMSMLPDMEVDIVPGSQYIGVPQVPVPPANAADLEGLPQRLQVNCPPGVRGDPPFNCGGVNNNQNP